MREQPTAAQLLDIAREIVKTEILPDANPAQKYALLMVANAISIAQRQIENGDAHLLAELDALQALLETKGSDAGSASDITTQLNENNRSLVAQIRTGAFDSGNANEQLKSYLWRTVTARVAESNPKAL